VRTVFFAGCLLMMQSTLADPFWAPAEGESGANSWLSDFGVSESHVYWWYGDDGEFAELKRAPQDGGPPETLARLDADVLETEVLPDGRVLAAGFKAVWMLAPPDYAPVQVAETDSVVLDFHPAGRHGILARTVGGTVYRLGTDGSWAPIRGVSATHLAADDTWLYFSDWSVIKRRRWSDGAVETVGSHDSMAIVGLAVEGDRVWFSACRTLETLPPRRQQTIGWIPVTGGGPTSVNAEHAGLGLQVHEGVLVFMDHGVLYRMGRDGEDLQALGPSIEFAASGDRVWSKPKSLGRSLTVHDLGP
jgi:hypothetical protein